MSVELVLLVRLVGVRNLPAELTTDDRWFEAKGRSSESIATPSMEGGADSAF